MSFAERQTARTLFDLSLALFSKVIEGLVAVLPLSLAGYLWLYQDAALRCEVHTFHVLAIFVACSLSGFVTFVTWRCWAESGEPFLRYITLALLAFTAIYLPHGLLTPWAGQNIWLFLLFGPASRFVMGAYMFLALCAYTEEDVPVEADKTPGLWRRHLLLIALVIPLVAALAMSPVAGQLWVRLVLEGGAVALCCGALVALAARDVRSPLMGYTRMALIFFAESSIVFLLGKPWNHIWWLAHLIFAAGFFILSYGVVRAYRSSKSFANVYSHEELLVRLVASEAGHRASVEAEERLRDILNASPMAVVVANLGGEILFRNHRLDALFGPSNVHLGGILQQALAGEATGADGRCEAPYVNADGKPGWLAVTISAIQYQGEAAAVMHLQDITALKKPDLS